VALGKEGSLPSATSRLSAKQASSLSAYAGSRQNTYFFNSVRGGGRQVTFILLGALLCRVLHSAKNTFAESSSLPSARLFLALGKGTLCPVQIFAECNTRQIEALPSARVLTLGKACDTQQIFLLP